MRLDDTIHLEADFFLNIAKNADGTIVSSAFKNLNSAAADADDRILYDRAQGDLFYDQDGSGTLHAAVKFADISNTASFTNADFVMI